jgi:hypothetical protein
MRIGLITAIYGDHDTLKPLPTDHGFHEAVCVTDNPEMHARGWRVELAPEPGKHPRLAARRPKIKPWEFLSHNVDASVWLDGGYSVLPGGALSLMASNTMAQAAVTVFPNNDGELNCSFWEQQMAPCLGLPKYVKWPLHDQYSFYMSDGMPDIGPYNFCNGMMVRPHSAEVHALGDVWSGEVERWGVHDQASLAYSLWKCGIAATVTPLSRWENPWVVLGQHNRTNWWDD